MPSKLTRRNFLTLTAGATFKARREALALPRFKAPNAQVC
jgi:hypothetical protein